jgi:hypothetical protein
MSTPKKKSELDKFETVKTEHTEIAHESI